MAYKKNSLKPAKAYAARKDGKRIGLYVDKRALLKLDIHLATENKSRSKWLEEVIENHVPHTPVLF